MFRADRIMVLLSDVSQWVKLTGYLLNEYTGVLENAVYKD